MTILHQIVAWTKLKCRIEAAEPQTTYFREREIWWASIGVNVGSEQNGKNERYDRPVLILKKLKVDLLWILPITTVEHVGTLGEFQAIREKICEFLK